MRTTTCRCAFFTLVIVLAGTFAVTPGYLAAQGTITPAFIGPSPNNFCYVDGTTNVDASSCAATFKTRGMVSGVIYDSQPYDITSNFFLGTTKFSGTWNMGTGKGGTNPSTGNPTAWVLEVPLILPNGTEISGMTGLGLGFGGDDSSATVIMSGTNFPGPIAPPASSTLTNVTTGGTLTATPIFVETVYTNNLMGSTSGNAVAGVSFHSPEQTFTPSSCVGGNQCSVTVTSPPSANCGGCLAGSPFNATGFAVCVGTVSGQEVCGCTGTQANSSCTSTTITCGANGVDTSDSNGACKLGSTAKITGLPSLPGAGTGAFAPPLVDLTSVMIVVGDNNASVFAGSNSFGQTLRNFFLVAGPTYAPSPTNPVATTPSVGVWNRTGQEASTIDTIGMWGPFQGANFYHTRGNTAGYRGFQPFETQYLTSTASSTTGTGFYGLIVDGCYYDPAGVVNVYASSFNYHPSGTISVPSSNIYVRGCNSSTFNGYGLHLENWISGAGTTSSDNLTCDWGANCNLFGGAFFVANGAGMHRTAIGGGIGVYGSPQTGFFGQNALLDDARTLSIKPGAANANIPITYDSRNYVAKTVLTSAFTSTSTTFTAVGTALGVEANRNYKGVCEGFYQGAAATSVVPSIEFTGPSSPTQFEFTENATTATGTGAATVYSQTANGFSTPLTPASITTLATDMGLRIEFYLRNGANAGTVQLLARSNSALAGHTLTIQPGFTCELTPQSQTP